MCEALRATQNKNTSRAGRAQGWRSGCCNEVAGDKIFTFGEAGVLRQPESGISWAPLASLTERSSPAPRRAQKSGVMVQDGREGSRTRIPTYVEGRILPCGFYGSQWRTSWRILARIVRDRRPFSTLFKHRPLQKKKNLERAPRHTRSILQVRVALEAGGKRAEDTPAQTCGPGGQGVDTSGPGDPIEAPNTTPGFCAR